MAEIKIYRRFYSIISDDSGETYTLINPFSISANSYNITQGSALVENNLTVTQSSTGIYYALLNGALYNSNDEYQVTFTVVYIDGTESKELYSQFKLNPVISPKGTLSVDMESPLVYEIDNKPITLKINVNNTTFEL